MSDYINHINKNDTNYFLSGLNNLIFCTSLQNQNKTINISNLPKGILNTTNIIFKIKFVYGNSLSSAHFIITNDSNETIYDESIIFDGDYRLDDDKIYDFYFDGSNFHIINFDSQISKTSLNTLTNLSTSSICNGTIINSQGPLNAQNSTVDAFMNGFDLINGICVKLLSTSNFVFGNIVPSNDHIVNFRINQFSYKPIKCVRNGALSNLKVHYGKWNNDSNYSYRVWDAFTTLNLVYSSSDDCWIIMNNPIFNFYKSSATFYNDYIIYANGLIKQWGQMPYGSDTGVYAYEYDTSSNFLIQYSDTNYHFMMQKSLSTNGEHYTYRYNYTKYQNHVDVRYKNDDAGVNVYPKYSCIGY